MYWICWDLCCLFAIYRKTSNKLRVSNRCPDSQNTYKAHTYIQNYILCTTKCANLTPLSIVVDDDKRININMRYTRYHNIADAGALRPVI